ncbi:MAG: patatin-like phospholipase family protein [Candidatus Binatia bacterium]
MTLASWQGGGAAPGLAHIGVLEVLERQGIQPDRIAGSSTGGRPECVAQGHNPSRYFTRA